MKCDNARPWSEIRPGYWLFSDSDGYTLRLRFKEGQWKWTVQPPGGGYDLFYGTNPDFQEARDSAEAALRALMDELRRGRRGPIGNRR
jgi:hypothetical protein